MSEGTNNWLMQLASASAHRLVETPPALLDPVGRSLRELAVHWHDAPRELKVLPSPAVTSRKGARGGASKGATQDKRDTGTVQRARQPTLMNVVEGSQAEPT